MINKSDLEREVSGLGDSRVKCPVCESEYNHIVNTAVNAGGDIYSIDSEGLKTTKGKPTGRGASIFITFSCESGHYWVQQYQFHKGVVLKEKYSIDDLDEPGEIWRD